MLSSSFNLQYLLKESQLWKSESAFKVCNFEQLLQLHLHVFNSTFNQNATGTTQLLLEEKAMLHKS